MTNNILINATYVNATENCDYGQTGIYESFTDKVGLLFKDCQKEFGRCVSSMYIDKKNGQTIKIGWVFEKKTKYEDVNEYYIQQTWISLHRKEPKKTIKYFYKKL